MKLPGEFMIQVEDLGKKVVAEDISRDDAAQTLAEKTYLRAKIRELLRSRRPAHPLRPGRRRRSRPS